MTYSQPLSLVPLQAGIIVTPLTEEAAEGNETLDSTQRAVVIGEPVPIIFCRRLNNIGGVFVNPAATEGRFANNATTNVLTVDYELVLSEGDMPQLQQNDCWQGACRVGTWTQSYDTRAGTFTPGNVTTVVAGTTPWNCPTYCGTGGSYDNLTTLHFHHTYPNGSTNWNKQVHVFVRQGLIVTRIMDSVVGSSDNFIDLAKYLITQTSRLPASMIDDTAMLAAATFLDANDFFYNGIFTQSSNLEDWMTETSFGFLLRISDNNGKKGFKPLLPTNANGTIKTTAITPEYTFTEEDIIPNGFQLEYIPLSERKPLAALMLWRQQPDNSIELIRSTEVRLPNTAADGPYQQYDLSQFCVTEAHAVKVGAYIVGKRNLVKHVLRISARPGAYSSSLSTGSIVRVTLLRETSTNTTSSHDYFYEVQRIQKGVTGIVQLDLIHFPVDDQGRSLLALLVDGATPSGYEYDTGSGQYTCDENDPNNSSPLPDVPGTPITHPDEPDVPSPGDEDVGKPPKTPNPPDPLDTVPQPTICGTPTVGNTLSLCDEVCPGGITDWYLVDVSGNAVLVSQNTATYYLDANNANLAGKTIYATTRCPDPSTPSGYGPPIQSTSTTPIQNDWIVLPPTGKLLYIDGTRTVSTSASTWCPTSGHEGQQDPGSIVEDEVHIGPYLSRKITRYRFVGSSYAALTQVCGNNPILVTYTYAVEYEYLDYPGTIDGQTITSIGLYTETDVASYNLIASHNLTVTLV